MRITKRYLKEWLQAEFNRLEVNLQVKDVYNTRCRRDEYEAGAAFFLIKVGESNGGWEQTVYVFYPLWYLQKELNNGYELYWKLRDQKYINESEIDIRKK